VKWINLTPKVVGVVRYTGVLRRIASILGVYRVYERILRAEIMESRIPSHIAVILDGNRRWARSRRLPLTLGYEAGARKVEELLKWCYDIGVKTVTLYVLSTENLKKRKPEEVEAVLRILKRYLEKELREGELLRRGVRVKALGLIEMLPSDIASMLMEVERRTENLDERFLNIAVAYGGRAEIVEAARRLARDAVEGKVDIDEIDESMFEKYLQTSHLPNPYPDLVIRTSGEVRISNFLLWQIAYSELVFLDVYWPEFRKIDLYRAIRTYQRRARRFGV